MLLLLEGARDDDGHIRGSRRRGHPWNPTQAAGGPLDRARGDLFYCFDPVSQVPGSMGLWQ